MAPCVGPDLVDHGSCPMGKACPQSLSTRNCGSRPKYTLGREHTMYVFPGMDHSHA